MRDWTDAELVARARHGDKAAFGWLIERYMPVARRVAGRMVAYTTLADDLAQEAMLQAYLSLDSLRDDARFATWLYGIVLNVCRSHIREQKIDWLPLDEMVGGRWLDINPLTVIEPGPEEIVEARDLHERVLRAVQALSPANREAVLLFYYDQLNLREAAVILDISPGALKGRLHRARQHLRIALLPLHEIKDEERNPNMIPVKFANVIRVENRRVQPRETDDPVYGHSSHWHVMLLMDEAEQSVLPIWIGQGEAQALVGGLVGTLTPTKLKRPLTWHFVKSLLDAADAKPESVAISALRDDVFYATARIRSGTSVHEIDARPSDAVPLALLMNCPLYVSETQVSSDAWWDIPDDFDVQKSLLGAGPGGIDIKPITAQLDYEQTFTEAEWEQLDADIKQQYEREHQQALRDFVFSS